MLALIPNCSSLSTLTYRLFSFLPALLLVSTCLSSVSACGNEDNSRRDEPVLQRNSEFNADSWKTVILDSCMRFFDGCNQCRRTLGVALPTCTRKVCVSYLEPRCLDEKMDAAALPKRVNPKKEEYICDGTNQFSIYYGSYSTGKRQQKLSADEMVLADRQTLSAYKLTKKMLGSVVVFADDNFALQSFGDEVQITLENELLYTNCKLRNSTE